MATAVLEWGRYSIQEHQVEMMTGPVAYYHAPNVVGNHKVWQSFEGYTYDQLQDGKLADNTIKNITGVKRQQTILCCCWISQTTRSMVCSF
jgi:hypothetical protein